MVGRFVFAKTSLTETPLEQIPIILQHHASDIDNHEVIAEITVTENGIENEESAIVTQQTEELQNTVEQSQEFSIPRTSIKINPYNSVHNKFFCFKITYETYFFLLILLNS